MDASNPAIALANVLERYKNAKEGAVVAIGANGIDHEKNRCYHSLGHISVIKIAKSYDVPVILFAEDLKISEKEDREINSSPQRKDAWLFTQHGFCVIRENILLI